MTIFALPEPTIERHLARTIDGKSLTGIPGEWSTRLKRKPFRKRRLTPYQLDYLHQHCTGYVVCNNKPHPMTRLWSVVSVFPDGKISLSHVWAHRKKAAIERHCELMGKTGLRGMDINTLAVPIGELP